jgi:hypothetical protein
MHDRYNIDSGHKPGDKGEENHKRKAKMPHYPGA